MSVSVDTDTRKQSDFLESAIAFVLVKKLWKQNRGDENVNVPIAIKIRDRYSEPFPDFANPACFVMSVKWPLPSLWYTRGVIA